MQQPTARPDRRRWLALLIVSLAQLMNTLDQTIVNVALPAIQRDLGFSQAGLAWVVDAYLIAFGGSLLLAGRLGDIVGRKRVFLSGVALFTAASLVCGLAESQTALVAARFVQGLGAALSSSVIVALIVAEFPDALARVRAMSAYIVVAVGGGSIGLLVGGVLTQAVGWHWNFLINLPIGLATLVASSRLVPDNEGIGFGGGLDVSGSVLATVGMMLGVYAIVASSELGPTATPVLAAGGAAVVLLGSFLVLQARLANPIMPLRILRARGLLGSSAVRGLTVVGLYATFFLGALDLQRVGGYDTLQTGAAFLPMTMAVLLLSLGATARLMARFGARRTALLGLLVMLAGVLVFTQTDGATGYFPWRFAGFLLVGLGGGTLFTPLLTMAIADVAAHDAGLASGIVNVSQNVSAAFAVAVLGSAAQGESGRLLAQGYAPLSALEGGFRAGYVVAAASVALGLLVALLVLRDHPPGRSEPAALAEEELALAA